VRSNRALANSYQSSRWYSTEAMCGSLPCGPYLEHYEVACAVCRAKDNNAEQSRSVYTRWGSRTCEDRSNPANMVYSGYLAGSKYTESGNGYNQLCVHETPTWSRYDADSSGNSDGNSKRHWDHSARLYGTEYHNSGSLDKNQYHDAACAVCATGRRAVHTVWGRTSCPYGPHWVAEYSGYAMASSSDSTSRQQTICVDRQRAVHKFSNAEENNDSTSGYSGRLYSTDFKISVFSGTYAQNADIACVVCSRVDVDHNDDREHHH